ncbi:MAG: MBL fold metallo-hydrolase [Prevotella sp.]|nr:MBL fold metallo-hydrolase [Prevotella sp.]MCR5152459.1 MBL fold metallo-hydrolase [Prevotella sp.]
MLKLLSLGSGSCGNSYLLYTSTDGLLIDAGISCRRIRKALSDYGLSIHYVRNIIITHDHADHIQHVGMLSEKLNVPVFTTSAIHNGIDKNICVKRKIPESNKKFLHKGEAMLVGEFEVTPFTVPHDSTDCVGYIIKCQDTNLVIMTDVGHVTDEMCDILHTAENLIIESNYDQEMLAQSRYPEYLRKRIYGDRGHLCNTECAQTVASCYGTGLRNVWLCHLSEENNRPDIALQTFEEVLLQHGISIGEQFSVTALKRRMPTGIFTIKS